ncbi:MAG TPA: DUF4105 domain-containing protein [Planctomycetota bacterium]
MGPLAPPAPDRSGYRSALRLLGRGTLVLLLLPAISWGCLALSLDGPGRVAAVLYALASLVLLVRLRPWPRGWLAALGLFLLVLGGWLTIAPSNEREWLPDVRALPRMRLAGERLEVTNVRDFRYRSETDFEARWEERGYDLAQVTGLDLLVCDWGEKWIVHTILSWEFADGRHLAISIETRKEVGEGYSAVRGFFRQFELYYVVGDERDLVGVRTNVRGERVRLYRLDVAPEVARALLRSYAARVEHLAVEPAWYNAMTQNCTTSIRLHAAELGRAHPWDWRILINGKAEELLYLRGQVDTSLPFAELRARSDVTAAAQAAGDAPDFSARIRAGLPPRPAAR